MRICPVCSLGEVLHAIKYGDKKGRLENLKAQNTADVELDDTFNVFPDLEKPVPETV